MSALRATAMTSAPASASATAQAAPIPEDAPVTNARLPSRRNDGVLGNFCADKVMCLSLLLKGFYQAYHFDSSKIGRPAQIVSLIF